MILEEIGTIAEEIKAITTRTGGIPIRFDCSPNGIGAMQTHSVSIPDRIKLSPACIRASLRNLPRVPLELKRFRLGSKQCLCDRLDPSRDRSNSCMIEPSRVRIVSERAGKHPSPPRIATMPASIAMGLFDYGMRSPNIHSNTDVPRASSRGPRCWRSLVQQPAAEYLLACQTCIEAVKNQPHADRKNEQG